MEIILKKDIKGLGYKNDIVKVKNGFGRNFLIPRGEAVVATISNKKIQAEEVKQSSFKDQKLRNFATEAVAKLANVSIQVPAKVGDSGRIFGSVSNIQVAEALKKAGIEIERKQIELTDDHVKTIGTYTATIRLYKDITSTLTFEVVADK